MKILYLHQHFTTPSGSGGTRSYEMARRLVAEGHEVTMVCGSYQGGDTGIAGSFEKNRRTGITDGISIIEFDLSYANSDGFIKRARTFLRYALGATKLSLTADYDVVFATTTPLTVGLPGIAARWLRRKPFVFEVRDLWPELPKAMGVIKNPLVIKLLSALEFASYRSAHRCIALSPGIKEGIAARGVHPDKIELVPNGCDIALFESSASVPWRPAGVETTDLMAVFSGTHGQANGLHNVLNAAKILQDRGQTQIKIVLIGNGRLKPDLVRQAAENGLTNVVFHDPVPKKQLTGLIASADIGIQSLANVPAFYYGTSPNKFFDYIAAGLPVLNNYPGWVADLVTENKCGFAIPPDDPEAFADALEDALAQRDQLPVMGNAAKALAKREFSRDLLGKRWITWVTGAADQCHDS